MDQFLKLCKVFSFAASHKMVEIKSCKKKKNQVTAYLFDKFKAGYFWQAENATQTQNDFFECRRQRSGLKHGGKQITVI